ncbi:NB-ARC domain-containing protein [Rugosimonospora africana]|uniref:NB-ARC domain-containing protein n=1 Tax=Rugosimonospora africana TaxID=556532 RepID=A0A8J3QP87_9ACTN|nr:NB-ARC domain-containing protein [Rugosimonospora africana]GIH14895.1 hypothetical protein Raf01_30670 [Rugosimonospora africana]
MTEPVVVRAFGMPPDPSQAGTLAELIDVLRALKAWAGNPSYDAITQRVNRIWSAAGRPPGERARKSTVADCFKTGRRRLNGDLLIAVVRALHTDVGYLGGWRQALRDIGAKAHTASEIRAQDILPEDLRWFTGRGRELRALRDLAGSGRPAAITIEGLAGVGKTQLAVHAAHEFIRQGLFERVLYVNLRGFHPDPAQAPADPVTVLDGFLGLLETPAADLPRQTDARTELFRQQLTGARILIVLDNAADASQVEPLLPQTAGCLALVTTRRRLNLAGQAVHRLVLDVLTPEEATTYLARAVSGTTAGVDADALMRIVRHCDRLPLTLSLIAAQIGASPGWTLADHAERIEDRHRRRRLESQVELALQLSYQHLPAARRRLLRLLTLHPGQDLSADIAGALAGTSTAAAADELRHLHDDHLLQRTTSGRYVLHDLVATFAADRACDEDAPSAQRAALTRLFDYFLTEATAAANSPYSTRPAAAPIGSGTARSWLDAERTTLNAIVRRAATGGWPEHAVRLSAILHSYVDGGYYPGTVGVHK